jgi:hypothetical protein
MIFLNFQQVASRVPKGLVPTGARTIQVPVDDFFEL